MARSRDDEEYELPEVKSEHQEDIALTDWLSPNGEPLVFPAGMDQVGTIYLPVNPIAEFLGVSPESQRRKVQTHPVIRRHAARMRLTFNPGGRQETVVVKLRILAYWLGNISPDQVREDLRGPLIDFQEALIDAAWELLERMASSGILKRAALPEPLTPEWAHAIEGQMTALQHEVTQALFALNGLRHRVRIVESVATSHLSRSSAKEKK